MTKNDIITLRIDGYSSNGDGVAHHDGRSVFVRRALLGELVSARILKATNTAVFAKIETLLEPSPERIAPECVHFGLCGGCSLMHMSYSEELRYKHIRISDALRRIGGIEFDLPPVVPSPYEKRYRNKAVFEVGFEKNHPVTGFYRERSHDIIPVADCIIQSESANAAAETVRLWMSRYKIPNGLIRYVFCRTATDGSAQIVIITKKKKLPEMKSLIDMLTERIPNLSGILLCINTAQGNTVLTSDIIFVYGDTELADTLCGNVFSLSPQSFYQVNHAQAEQLYDYALLISGLKKDDVAVELYSGAGTITLALAKAAGFVYGIEIVTEAVLNAKKNAERNGVKNVEFILGDAGESAHTLQLTGVKPSVVVVDPPRKGLSTEALDAIIKMSPERVVYVSCDPATLARDVKLLAIEGYHLSEAQAFDMFPRCSHVETLVLLSRINVSPTCHPPNPHAKTI